ncbi:fluoride efflux transporter CrcB [Croceitalea sp. MTPC9]|uniref:fluoride efflux transporter CrcB n=1 Tax=unclassified Croceitalea TaxID=2632280 RepID=UPI002B365700|nr:fluoride efflux transporter CrcB [Croceitalea sp. MTPC6]GMN15077.1 fluoride efflux transporter CrcB [Croceitalea sp. MTPC9]
MKQAFLVFLGGGLGSVARFMLSKILNPYFQHFFLGTFLVNSIGCLLIGIILGLSVRSNVLSENYTLLLATGFCGGFTTFSAFAFEKHSLLKSGEFFHFSFYTLSSIIIGLIAVFIGVWISKLY